MKNCRFDFHPNSANIDSEQPKLSVYHTMEELDNFNFENCEEEGLDDHSYELIPASSASDDGSSGEEKSAKKSALGKRIRYKYYIRLPKVLKRDIRRQYPLMIANIMNSNDFELFHSFFRTFSYNSVGFKLHNLASLGIDSHDAYGHLFMQEAPPEVDYQGYHWIFYHWHVLTSINPDYVVKVHEAKIVTHAGSERSQVVMDLEIDFTRMYDIQFVWFLISIFNSMLTNGTKPAITRAIAATAVIPEPISLESELDFDSTIISAGAAPSTSQLHSLLSLNGEENSITPPDPFQFYLQRAGSPMPLLDTPEQMALVLRFTFHLNDQKQIELLETSNLNILTK